MLVQQGVHVRVEFWVDHLTFANGSVILGVEAGFEKIPLSEWNWFELRLTYLDS